MNGDCGNISLTNAKNLFSYILSYFTVSLFKNKQNIQININELEKIDICSYYAVTQFLR